MVVSIVIDFDFVFRIDCNLKLWFVSSESKSLHSNLLSNNFYMNVSKHKPLHIQPTFN